MSPAGFARRRAVTEAVCDESRGLFPISGKTTGRGVQWPTIVKAMFSPPRRAAFRRWLGRPSRRWSKCSATPCFGNSWPATGFRWKASPIWFRLSDRDWQVDRLSADGRPDTVPEATPSWMGGQGKFVLVRRGRATAPRFGGSTAKKLKASWRLMNVARASVSAGQVGYAPSAEDIEGISTRWRGR